jgi:hypothetical protein
LSDFSTAQGPVQYTAWVAPTCVLNTPATAPTTTAAPIETSWLWTVNIRIPPGHAGLTGIALVDSGQFILPYSVLTPAWLIGDDDDLFFPYGQQVGSNVTFLTYNTDETYNHGWQVRLVYTPMSLMGVSEEAVITTPDVSAWLTEVTSDAFS